MHTFQTPLMASDDNVVISHLLCPRSELVHDKWRLTNKTMQRFPWEIFFYPGVESEIHKTVQSPVILCAFSTFYLWTAVPSTRVTVYSHGAWMAAYTEFVCVICRCGFWNRKGLLLDSLSDEWACARMHVAEHNFLARWLFVFLHNSKVHAPVPEMLWCRAARANGREREGKLAPWKIEFIFETDLPFSEQTFWHVKAGKAQS